MKVVVLGACGQIGSELVPVLRKKYGDKNVVASDIDIKRLNLIGKPFEVVDVTDADKVSQFIGDYKPDAVFHLAAILSALGEKNPQLCFRVNIDGLYNVFEASRICGVKKLITPSSIAAFGFGIPQNPDEFVPRWPDTMYGISKVFTELLGIYYYKKFNLDVRGVIFPGIISGKTKPGGGTTDYAVEVFYEAITKKRYTYFVREDTVLPMMYMPDAVKSLINLMEADNSVLTRRFYNVSAFSFSAGELTEVIKRFIPEFEADYKPDYRQKIADSWPKYLNDSAARKDWGWKPDWDLESMAIDMINNLKQKLLSK